MTIEVREQAPSAIPGDAELRTSADPSPMGAEHTLDSPEALADLRRTEDWFCEATDSLAETFNLIQRDHDYYDHLQFTDEEKQEMLSRGQAPLVFNKAAMAVDWLTGTERRTRIDFKVSAKRKDGADNAATKQKLLKYQSDTNRIGWNRSGAFKDAAIGGIGWTETSLRGDHSQELVLHTHVPWSHIRYDPFSRRLDCDDMRYIHRTKWVDLDYAIAQFPERAAQLTAASRSHLFGEEEWSLDMVDLPQMFRRYDSRGAEIVQRRWAGALPIVGSQHRQRVRLTDTWYREPRRIQRVWGVDLPGVEYTPGKDAEIDKAVQSKYASLSDAVTEDIRVLIWVPGAAVFRALSPFRHGGFPFTPVWGKRRDRDGMPYGVIRGIVDAQDDYNKRRSKMLWLLSSNQLIHEENAIDPDRKADVQRNLAKPNGMIEVRDGALTNNRIKIERNIDLADAQTMLLEEDAAHIHDGAGVNRELLGRDTNAVSGRAIKAKQDEGAVTTAEYFDNLRLATQLDGGKLLSLSEQFMTLPMQIRVTGDGPTTGTDYVDINQPELVDGAWVIKNDITKADSDFVVDQIDFRESTRAAQAEQMMEMLKTMPPEVQLNLLDIVIEMTDVPQRAELVKRIRSMSGQADPEAAKDPAAMAAQQARQQRAERDQALNDEERTANIQLTRGKAQQAQASAQKTLLDAKGQAIDIVALIEALLPLAPAADRLYLGTKQELNPQ